MVEKENKYKLKVRNFWRRNRHIILVLLAAFLIGLTIAGINYLNYQNTVNKFQLEESQKIDNQNNAKFHFILDDPNFARGTTLRMQLENVSSNLPLVVYINGEKQEQLTSNSQLIRLEPDILKVNNTVEVRRNQIGFEDQALLTATVKSRTNIQQLTFVVLNLSALLLMAAPIMYIKYKSYKRQKKVEDKFPEFLRDVVEGTSAGMSLPQAIQNSETGSYGPLDEKIEKMNSKLDWGIPFDKVLTDFAEDTNSSVIRRSVDTIIQAYQSGGDIQKVLSSVGENIRSIKKLKEQRESQLYGEMITGYIVFFIFIGILVALTNYLLPNIASAQQSLGGSAGGISAFGGSSGPSLQENISLYKQWFQRLVYIQALFSGLIIGKLSEGELKAGFKHMAILFAVGYVVTTFFL